MYDRFRSAQQSLLEVRIRKALKLDNGVIGSTQVGTSSSRLNWIAYIQPSFDKLAILAVATEVDWNKTNPSNITEQVQGALAIAAGKGRYATLEKVSTISATLAPEWEDPVGLILDQLNTFPQYKTNSRDGIGYRLQIYGNNLNEVALDFNNPHTKALIELEGALLQVATEIVKLSGGEPERQYLKGWERYTDRKSS